MVNYGTLTEVTSYCMLELARRGSGDTLPDTINDTALFQNRIGLLATNINIATNKQSIAFPVPFSGIISGESSTLALDLGLATKTVSINGILSDQMLFKKTKNGTQKNKKLTAYEMAQLLHSYVDSSFLHEDQNVSKLIVLIPSRVDTNFEYHAGVNENTPLSECPLIPFHFGNRTFDMPTLDGTKIDFGATEFPSALANIDQEIPGMSGFINDFSTDIAGDQIPSINFTLNFTISSTAMSDFINKAF